MFAENKFKHIDRNGLYLQYGDKVFIKSWWKTMYLFTIVGFTETQVACLCGNNVFYRKPTNVIKVTNPENWKI